MKLTAKKLTAEPLTARKLTALRVGEALGTFNPASLFADSDTGAFFDLSNSSTLFQDSAGTTSVTAVGDPVGLALDQSQGTTSLTNNLAANAFDYDAAFVTNESEKLGSGQVRIYTSDGANSAVGLSGVTQSGEFFLVSFDVVSVDAGNSLVVLNDYDTGVVSGLAGGEAVSIVVAATTTTLDIKRYSGITDITIENISFRKLPGNHATQTTDTARPVWARVPEGGRRNELDATETLSTQDVTVTAAERTLSFKGTGTVTLSGASTAGPLVGTGAGDRVTLTFTPTAGTLSLTVSGTVTDAQLELGSTATAYQKVVADYDITEAGVASVYYPLDDGVDDALTVAMPDLGTDATRFVANLDGTVTYLENQTIGAGDIDIPLDKSSVIYIDRDLTAGEKTDLEGWA